MTAHRVSATFAALAVGLAVLGAASAASAQDNTRLFAVLNGSDEVNPTTGQPGAGDPDGSGAAAVSLVAADQLCFSVLVNHLDPPMAAHIHQGAAGTNGPIVVPLIPDPVAPPPTGDPGFSGGCVPGVDPTLLESIRGTPSEFYFNVHTGPFPNGAVRGQLFVPAIPTAPAPPP
jgi:CHRD domain